MYSFVFKLKFVIEVCNVYNYKSISLYEKYNKM